MDDPSFPSFHDQEVELTHGDMSYWAYSPDRFDLLLPVHDPPPPAMELSPELVSRSAFVKYARRPSDGVSPESSSSRVSGARNIHHRVTEMLRRIPVDRKESKHCEGSRGFRHMMRERERREKLSQSYADLYSMLSSRSKADKNSIVQSAAMCLRELKKTKEDLQRRNEELRSRIANQEARTEVARIRIRAGNCSSTIDSMIGVLRCLKGMNVKATSIQSNFSGHELSAVISMETTVATSEVEKVERAVERALGEVSQLRSQLPRN